MNLIYQVHFSRQTYEDICPKRSCTALILSAVRTVHLRHDRPLLRFRLVPSLWYFLTFFQILAFPGTGRSGNLLLNLSATSWRLPVLIHSVTTKTHCSLVSCIMQFFRLVHFGGVSKIIRCQAYITLCKTLIPFQGQLT